MRMMALTIRLDAIVSNSLDTNVTDICRDVQIAAVSVGTGGCTRTVARRAP